MKKIIFASLIIIIVMSLGETKFLRAEVMAPSNESIIQDFNKNKHVYDQIRDLLYADKNVRQIADWGIRTSDAATIAVPPVPDLSLERYKKYLSLLSLIHAKAASRTAGVNPDICIFVWSSGWASDTNHIALCWREDNTTGGSDKSSLSKIKRHFIFYPVTERWFIQREQ